MQSFLHHDKGSLALVDKKLEDLSSKKVMQKNGWTINADNKPERYWNGNIRTDYSNQCGRETWFGYNYGPTVGWVKTTFRGNGVATLNFGNCNIKGEVIVYLNENEIAKAYNNTPKVETNFEYNKGDVLSIKEVDTAIIKLNSLKLYRQGSN